MGEHDGNISTLIERSENSNERIKKLEENQRWGIITVIGLLANSVFEYLTRGVSQ